MNTEQAYINGFVKRASEYGYDESQAIEILKSAGYLPHTPPPTGRGTRRPIYLGKGKGLVNEVGLHVPTDKGSYLDRRTPNTANNPRLQAHLDHLEDQHHIDDIVDSLAH